MMQGPGWFQFQTLADATAMSAFLPLATTERTSLEVRFVPILLQKSAAAEGLAAIKLMSAGFDPPTLAALRNFDATRCTKPE